MIPLIELKGAVPFGMSKEVFGSNALSPFSAWLASSTGSLVPAFFLIWIFAPLMTWLKKTKMFKRLSTSMETKFKSNADKLSNGNDQKRGNAKKYIGLILFVAIPLPLTGAYTGSAIASYLGLSYVSSLICIFIGNIIAGGIMVLLCTVFAGYEGYVFLGFLCLLLMALIIAVIKKIINRRNVKNAS